MKLVFVSSTFKDMQYERDLLQTYAIPVLDDALREYGEKAYFGDLRWGVNTTDLDSDEGSKKVLQVCLDQIDNCKPYMIVLIGERYGWIPAQTLLDEACVLKGIEKIQDISVTELEIDYGALLEPECEGRIMFYFRDLDTTGMTEAELRDYQAESPLHAEKIEALKARIQKAYPNQIRHYTAKWDPVNQEVAGLEGFLQQVEKDLSDVLLRDLEAMNQIPWQERCAQSAQRWLETQYKHHVEDAVQLYTRYRGKFDDLLFVYLTGPEGAGKTSLLSWYQSNCPWEHSFSFSFGLDKFSTDSDAFAKLMLYHIESVLGMPHRDMKDYDTEPLLDAIEALADSEDGRLAIYIDNGNSDLISFLARLEQECIDRLGPVKTLILGESLYFVIAMQENIPYYPFFHNSTVLEIGDVQEEEAPRLLDGIVKSHHKELSDEVKERILSKPQHGSAAYLRSVVKRLMLLDSEDFAAIRAMGDGMENINKYMLSIVDSVSDDRYGVYLELINEAAQRIDREFVDRLISVFTYVPVGLTVEELKGIFAALNWQYNDLSFALTIRMLEDVIFYNPDLATYRAKNRKIRAMLQNNIPKLGLKPIAQHMLTVDSLRPYAFGVAGLCDDAAFACKILDASGSTEVSYRILYLIENGMEKQAIDILAEAAKNKPLWRRVERWLPSLSDYSLDYRRESSLEHPMMGFLDDLRQRLYGLALERLTDDNGPGNKLVLDDTESAWFETAMSAQLMVAEAAHITDPAGAMAIMDTIVQKLRRAAPNLNSAIYNRFYFLPLKIASRSFSSEHIEMALTLCQNGEVFFYDGEYDEKILRMKVYQELHRCYAHLSMNENLTAEKQEEARKLSEEYVDKAYQVFSEDGYNLSVEVIKDLTDEDCLYLGYVSEDAPYFLSLGKRISATSLDILDGECTETIYDLQQDDNASEENAEDFRFVNDYDQMQKSYVLLDDFSNATRVEKYLESVNWLMYIHAESYGENAFPNLDKIVRNYAFWFRAQHKKERLSMRICTGSIGVFSGLKALGRQKLMHKLYKVLFEELSWEEPMAMVVQQYIKYSYITPRKLRIRKVYQAYMAIRELYADSSDRAAIMYMDTEFSNLGFDTPFSLTEVEE